MALKSHIFDYPLGHRDHAQNWRRAVERCVIRTKVPILLPEYFRVLLKSARFWVQEI
jgi:hypothetical protein